MPKTREPSPPAGARDTSLRLPRRVLLAAATAGVAGVLGLPATAGAQEHRWIAGNASPQTDVIGRSLDYFAERVQELSDGRIVIETHHGGALGGERDMIESVLQGAMQVVIPGKALLAGWYPPAEIWIFPYLFESVEHKDRVWDTIRDEYAEDVAATAGLRPLSAVPRSPRMLSANKVVRTPEDMRGLRIRVPETPMWLRTFERFGASPTPLPFPEVYQALRTGVIDGQENPMALTYHSGFFEVNTHLNQTEHMMQDNTIVVGENVYQSLPDDLKEVLHQAARDTEQHFRPIVAQEDEEILQEILDMGIVVSEVDKDAFRATLVGLEEEFPHVKKWLERIRQID